MKRMEYSKDVFKFLSEREALKDALVNLSPLLLDVLAEAKADVEAQYPSNLLWDHQNQANISRMINQRCARIWDERADGSWILSDRAGFLHIEEPESHLKAILRRVDPLTRKLPKSNATRRGRAYYTQSRLKPAGMLRPVAKPSLLASPERVVPDLSESRLILAWQTVHKDALDVVAYRPLEPGRYASNNKYDFSWPMIASSTVQKTAEFIPQDTEDNLLPGLLVDDYVPEDFEDADIEDSTDIGIATEDDALGEDDIMEESDGSEGDIDSEGK